MGTYLGRSDTRGDWKRFENDERVGFSEPGLCAHQFVEVSRRFWLAGTESLPGGRRLAQQEVARRSRVSNPWASSMVGVGESDFEATNSCSDGAAR